MVFNILYPFVDVRRFFSVDHLPLATPSWPAPTDDEFVRSFGGIFFRRVPIFSFPEPRVCNAHRAIRIPPFFLPNKNGRKTTSRFLPVSRRLFFDGRATGKIEIVVKGPLETSTFLRDKSRSKMLTALGLAEARAIMPSPYGNQVENTNIVNYQFLIPKQWILATTSHRHYPAIKNNKAWVGSGAPLVIAYAWERKPIIDFKIDNQWELETNLGGRNQKIRVAHWSRQYKNNLSDLWMITSRKSDRPFARSFRISLLQLHADTTALRILLKFLGRDDFFSLVKPRSPGCNLMQRHLHDTGKRLKKLIVEAGEQHEEIIKYAYRLYAESMPGEIEVVLERLGNIYKIRGNYFRNIRSFLEEFPFEERDMPKMGGVIMPEKIIINSGGGDVALAGDSSTVEIKKSGDTYMMGSLSDELIKLSEELAANSKTDEEKKDAETVRLASQAAKIGNKKKMMELLGTVGKRVFEVATKIGTNIAAEIIKKQIGL